MYEKCDSKKATFHFQFKISKNLEKLTIPSFAVSLTNALLRNLTT